MGVWLHDRRDYRRAELAADRRRRVVDRRPAVSPKAADASVWTGDSPYRDPADWLGNGAQCACGLRPGVRRLRGD